MLREGAVDPSYTLEFGIVAGTVEKGRPSAAHGLLRSRWSRLLTDQEPGTDFWVAFDDTGPFLTAYGKPYGHLTKEQLRSVVTDQLIPLLAEYTTLSDIERVLEQRRDWITGAIRTGPPGFERWCIEQLDIIGRLRLSGVDGGAETIGSQGEQLDSIVVERWPLDDLDAGAEINAVGDFIITFGDELAHDYPEAVARSVSFVETYPKVRAARQEDRELIIGWGSPDLPALETWLRRRWVTEILSKEQWRPL